MFWHYSYVKNVLFLHDRIDYGTVTFRGTIFFIMAPWLRDLVMDADTSDPFELIPIVLSATKDFDRGAAQAVPPFEEDKQSVIHGGDFAL